MAEKTQGVQNLWLLATAIVLGLLAVVIYNVHISAIRDERKSQTEKVLTVAQDIRKGQSLKDSFLIEEEIFRDKGGAWEKHVLASRRDSLIKGKKPVFVTLRRGEYLMECHLTRPDQTDVAGVLRPGMVGKTISVASDESPGDLLRADGYIDLLGIFQTKEGRFETIRILEGVRVVSVGGTRPNLDDVRHNARAVKPLTNFRKIMLEVAPDISTKLANLETHCVGEFMLDIVPEPSARHAAKITTKLDILSRTAKPKVR